MSLRTVRKNPLGKGGLCVDISSLVSASIDWLPQPCVCERFHGRFTPWCAELATMPQGLGWWLVVTSKVEAHGNVSEAMWVPSRRNLPRLHPVPSGTAQFPSAAMHKATNAIPPSQLTKQMTDRWKTSLGVWSPEGNTVKQKFYIHRSQEKSHWCS